MSARFEVVRSDAEQPWHARFVAARIVAATETYARKVGAQRAVRSIVRGVLNATADWLDEYATAVFWRTDSAFHQNERMAYHAAADLLRQAITAEGVAAAMTADLDERTGR